MAAASELSGYRDRAHLPGRAGNQREGADARRQARGLQSGSRARSVVDEPVARVSRHAGHPGGSVLDHDRGRQRPFRPAGGFAHRHGPSVAQGSGRCRRNALVDGRVSVRRRLPGHSLGRRGHAAADGHLLSDLHAARGLRIPPSGRVQSGCALQEGRRAWQAGADDVYGLRVQRSGRRRHARH